MSVGTLSSLPDLNPLNNSFEREESELEREVKQTNAHLGHLFVQLQMHVEDARNGKIHAGLSGVENIHAKLKKMNSFLDMADAHLANKDAKNFDIRGNQQIMQEMFELVPDELLKKETLSRDQLESLSKNVARRSEHLSRTIPLEMMQVQRSMEERHEMVKSLKDLLSALIRHVEHIINNPR